jgi:hypothetical protein
LIDRIFNLTDRLFLNIYLMSFLVCGLIGIVLCSIGISRANKQKSGINKHIGIAGLILGIVVIVASFIGTILFLIPKNQVGFTQ